jgi:antitoxin MazE
MSHVIKSHLIQIGNSRGVRIPKVCLEQLNLGDEVELAVQSDQLVIRSARHPRQGWEESFRAMHERADDRLLDIPALSDWDEHEWEW